MGKKTYHFCDLRKGKDFNKKELTLRKIMCVMFLLCGPWADLWLFYGGVNGAYIINRKLNNEILL